MKKQINIFNEKSITIFTILMIICAMIVFEIGYCNTQLLKGLIEGSLQNNNYNFSLCRLVIYIVFVTIYILFRKKFIKEALEISKSKYKRVFIYMAIIALIISIVFSVILCMKNIYLIRALSIALITAFLGTLFVIYVSNNIIKNVIIIACTFGIVFTITTDYNHAIDEKKHFMSAFNLSYLNFNYDKNPITDKNVEKIPHLSKYTTIDSFMQKYEPEISNEVNKEDVPSIPAGYNFLTYTFPAIGIAIARVLGGSIIDMYILGRIMNLLLYTTLICIALKIIPYKKNIFFVIAMMPYALLLAASYSIDGFCIGTVFIFIAYCLKLKKEAETISLKQFLILLALFLVLLLAKSMAYVLVGVIILILPLLKTIKKNKKYIPIIAIISVILIIGAILLAIYVKNTRLIEDTRAQGEINSGKQLELLLTNPIHDIKLLIEHTKTTLLSFDWYLALNPDVFFTPNCRYVMLPLIIYILYVSLTETDYIFKIKDKIIMMISFLMVWGMTSVALYLTFTQVGALHVAGYQTRYILPIMPLALFSIANNKVITKKSENRNMNIAIISAIFLAVGIMQLIIV